MVLDIENAVGELKEFHAGLHRFFMTKTRYVAGQALQYSQGLLFGSERKNMTNMEKTVPNSDPQALQHFLSNSQWDEEGVITEIPGRISELIGTPAHGSLHFDESWFLKDGAHSVGTNRQYCGRFGKVDNCQVGVFLRYAVHSYRALVDKRIYLPRDWAEDPVRRKHCGVPAEVTFKTKAELALDMLSRARVRGVPFAWVGMVCFYGQQPWLLEQLESEETLYLYIADIPNDTRVWRNCPKVEVPERKWKPGPQPWRERVVEGELEPIKERELAKEIPDAEKERIFLRDTERKELWCNMVCLRVYPVRDELPGPESWLIIRWDDNGEVKYQFSNASADTKINRLAEMSCSRYRIERAFENAKGEVGVADYEVRGWLGWHHHTTMVLLAMLFLLILHLKWKGKAPLLTIQDVREILEVVLPRKVVTKEELLKRIERKHKARESARKSHHKRNSKPG
ncbi:MAG: IS701 family transposase [Euryarchaeota archaeon]|nr:IS701 family transposase [Euryarchaeota archaeon]